MLVTIPIGLWVFSLVCDIIARNSAQPETWSTIALYTMVGGIVGALAAALPGLVDLLSLRDKPVFKTALAHMALNLVVVTLYVVNAWTRANDAASPGMALGLSLVAIALLLVSGWLGGKMVYLGRVAVHEEGEAAVAHDPWRANRPGSTRSTASGGMPPRMGERAMASDRDVRETDRS
jgi:uncharacterized membrane protein